MKNKLTVPCTKLAIIWSRKDSDFINVITAYFTNQNSPYCPDEPGNILRKVKMGKVFTPEMLEESLNFWSKHAFVEPIPFEYLNK